MVPYEYDRNDKENAQIYVSEIWRFIFAIPGIIAFIQVICLTTVFTYDTPVYYEQIDMLDKASEVYSKIYIEQNTDSMLFSTSETELARKKTAASFTQIFESDYRYTLFIGIMIFVFTNLTGINAILFYSNEIFTQKYTGYYAEREARIGTLMIGLTMFITSFSTFALSELGRRTTLIIGH